ncbi:MAG: bifunctional 4-hydroxy-3-methylbut-2-enyl diphosphate reductase/30S ribosomal protein S1 [Clostridiales bacterium]|nr:bifunctional 4-hydroxy-3-methylbut-2-enyl diphosphate reductase/30S ribosomal protein S1 [Clostridiales bacterium]
MQIKLAETAGFCFGVNRAVNLVYDLIEKGERVCTLGPIIHNRQLVDDLYSKGAKAINTPSECRDGYKIIVRTHGVEKDVIEDIKSRNIPYVDATCPFVLKIHKIVSAQPEGTVTLIAGDREHPEVKGIKSFCRGKTFVFKNESELTSLIENNDFFGENSLICVSQTTFSRQEWKKCEKILEKVCTNCKIFDTICNATSDRQAEALSLSEECDAMIVIGGRHSSNTCKLRDVCSENALTFLIETASELSEIDFSGFNVVGVTAGASTPSAIIKEILKTMSEEIKEKEVEAAAQAAETAETADQADKAAVEASADGETFAEMLEQSFSDDDTSKIVKGVVVNITPSEVFVDVPGRKQTGVIAYDDLSSEPFDKCEDVVSIGDELDLMIMKTDDQDGVLKLSKKLTDAFKGWDDIVKAKENDEILEAPIVAVVRDGVLASVKGTRIFIPASLSGVPKNQDLDVLKGTTARFKVIDINTARRRAVGSIKVVANEEKKAAREAAWAKLEEGMKLTGTVKSLTNYGAFVDIGGIDGMIHISELSWTRIKHPSEVVKVGDQVEVYIKSLDEETKKISLGFKKVEDNPWEILKRDYPVGTELEAKIVGLTAFGAFATVIPGIEGLIHISQISWDRIKTPADVLKVGDVVKVVITDIDFDKKRVSLSMKQLLEKPEESINFFSEKSE